MVLQWLFIDTSESGRVRYGLIGQKSQMKEIQGRSGSLLPALSRLKLQNLAGICVVEGPGSFSAVRGGIIVANLLSRTMKLPLFGIPRDEAMDLGALVSRLRRGEIPVRGFVPPIYDAEPNITMKHA